MKRIQQIVNNENHTNGNIRVEFVKPIRIICSFVNSFNIKKGFTLIELLLVIGIAAIIFAFAAPYSLNFYRSNLIDDAQSNIIDALTRARHNAELQKNDSQFGVYLVKGGYTIFQGDSYGQVPAQDEIFSLVSSIDVATTTIIFSKLTGAPSATGTISLTYGTLSRGILIDDAGVISKTD